MMPKNLVWKVSEIKLLPSLRGWMTVCFRYENDIKLLLLAFILIRLEISQLLIWESSFIKVLEMISVGVFLKLHDRVLSSAKKSEFEKN